MSVFFMVMASFTCMQELGVAVVHGSAGPGKAQDKATDLEMNQD